MSKIRQCQEYGTDVSMSRIKLLQKIFIWNIYMKFEINFRSLLLPCLITWVHFNGGGNNDLSEKEMRSKPWGHEKMFLLGVNGSCCTCSTMKLLSTLMSLGVNMMERKPFQAFCEFWFHLLLSSYTVLKCIKIRRTSSEYGTLWVFPFYKTWMWPSFSLVQFSANQIQSSSSMHYGFVPGHNMEISV